MHEGNQLPIGQAQGSIHGWIDPIRLEALKAQRPQRMGEPLAATLAFFSIGAIDHENFQDPW
jgi:hypothetical protein